MTDILEKVMTTTTVGIPGAAQVGGLLTARQANRFLDYMWDATVLGNDARTERVTGDTAELDRMHVGQRILRAATEAVDDHVNVNVTFSKISITTKKLRLDWELSRESLEDNIEGEDLEDHIARLMATQVGNDLEDLAINGDAALADPLLKTFDGWKKIAMNGAIVLDNGGGALDAASFNGMLKALPRRYKQRRNQLRFYAGSNVIQDYLFELSQSGPETIATGLLTGSGLGPSGATGGVYPYAFGIPIKEVPLYSDVYDETAAADRTHVDLTFPGNRVWTVKREVEVFREFKPKKDTIEYTVYCRAGVAIEDLAAWVVLRNVAVSSGYNRNF